MELNLNSNLEMLEMDELELLNGGISAMSIVNGLGGIASTIAICQAIGGTSVTSMSVGALLACGPAGWALVTLGIVGGAASGYVIAKY